MIARLLPALASAICAISVALGAYASHVAAAPAKERLAVAALFAFAHSLALIMLAPRAAWLARACQGFLLAGICLFSGSLAAAGLFGTSTAAAPLGGTLIIFGWLLAAADYWRNP